MRRVFVLPHSHAANTSSTMHPPWISSPRPFDGESRHAPVTAGDPPTWMVSHFVLLPFCSDAARLPQLRQSVAAYRLAFGQPRQQELVEYLGATCSEDEIAELAQHLRIDLTPPALTTTSPTI